MDIIEKRYFLNVKNLNRSHQRLILTSLLCLLSCSAKRRSRDPVSVLAVTKSLVTSSWAIESLSCECRSVLCLLISSTLPNMRFSSLATPSLSFSVASVPLMGIERVY